MLTFPGIRLLLASLYPLELSASSTLLLFIFSIHTLNKPASFNFAVLIAQASIATSRFIARSLPHKQYSTTRENAHLSDGGTRCLAHCYNGSRGHHGFHLSLSCHGFGWGNPAFQHCLYLRLRFCNIRGRVGNSGIVHSSVNDPRCVVPCKYGPYPALTSLSW